MGLWRAGQTSTLPQTFYSTLGLIFLYICFLIMKEWEITFINKRFYVSGEGKGEVKNFICGHQRQIGIL